MKTPNMTPTTRASLLTTASCNNRWFASLLAGTAVLGSSALADVNNNWTGAALDSDWNNAANWSLGTVPKKDRGAPFDNNEDAVISVTTGFPVVVANTGGPPRDIKVGFGLGDGRLDVKAGTAASGSGNWFMVGCVGNAGTLNVADVDAGGGTLTGFGTGTGNINVPGGRLWVGGWPFNAGGNGTLNVNTTGTLAIGSDLGVGTRGTGIVKVDSGNITTGGWNFFGKNDGGGGGNGTLNMSGGTFTNTGRTYVGQQDCTGAINLTGGDYLNVNNEQFIVGENSGSNGDLTVSDANSLLQVAGELWLGQGGGGNGSLTISAGAVTIGNWFAIGRSGATGTLDLDGGSVTKTGGGDTILGSDGAGGSGTITQDGGSLTLNNTMKVGASGGSTGVWTLNAGTANIDLLIVGDGGNGTADFNGGTLTVRKISGGGGPDVVNFDGTSIVVGGTPVGPFMENLDDATIGTAGLPINTNGINVSATAVLDGPGGITKTGAGTLTLSGANTYTGNNVISSGKLATNTAVTGSGDYSVADGATLGVSQVAVDQVLNVPNVTFGTSAATALDVDFGNFAGNSANAPLNVTGTLTLNGNVTINVTDQLPEVGTIPLVSYVGPKGGSGNFVLGTLPNGVVATLSDVGGLVSLNVTSVAIPYWDATVNSVWDTTTVNWINLVGGAPVAFANGNPALFDDFADGPGGDTNVVLNSTVLPAATTFSNTGFAYTLSGTGSIGGSGGLLKQGTASLSITTLNNYTGATRLEGGVTTIDTVAAGGNASSIGASSAAASNLVLAGGTLVYNGAASGSTDRGFTIDGASSIQTEDDLTFSGSVASLGGSLTKTGAANLSLSGASNVIGIAGQASQVIGGTLTLDGAGATTSLPGDLWVGSTPNVSGNVVVDGGTFNVGSWISVGRGNGDSGTISNFTANNATVSCTNFSTGYDNGLPNNSVQNVTLSGATTWTNNGITQLAESANAVTNMTIEGTSSYVSNGRFTTALGLNSVVNMTVKDSGSFTKTGGWLSIGNGSNGNGNLLVRDNGTFSADGDFNVADVDTSTGTITIQDSALVTSTGTFFVGKNAGTVGTANLNGGTLRAIRVRGGGGSGNFTFNGGTLQALPAADGNFMSLLTNVVVEGLGGTIDTNGNNVTVAQTLLEGVVTPGGGITKTGAGTLTLNTANTYTGTTTVAAGTLAGTGFVAGPLVVSSTGTIAPGNTVGTFSSVGATISGTYACELNGVNNDLLDVTGALDLSAATDVLAFATPGAGATKPVYIIANYTTLTGTFDSVTGTPGGGYVLDYNYLGGNQIALVRPATAYETWADTYFPGETNPAIIGTAADPDGDGQPNGLEFALGGAPNSGSNNAKVYHLEEDTADAGSAKELLLTIAVRSGAPAFAGSPSPTSTHDGATYTIQGSTDLATFATPVSVVAPVTTGLPAAPAGYVYRTFSLDGSDGLPSKGFLRVNVTP